jgi:hypothetical protein
MTTEFAPPRKFCSGEESYMSVYEIEAKAWRDDDRYEMVCRKCGKKEEVLSRRPHETIMLCGNN